MGYKKYSKNKLKTSVFTKKAKALQKTQKEAQVLYQKMGNRWFAFSVVDDEVYSGSCPVDDVMAEKLEKKIKDEEN